LVIELKRFTHPLRPFGLKPHLRPEGTPDESSQQ